MRQSSKGQQTLDREIILFLLLYTDFLNSIDKLTNNNN